MSKKVKRKKALFLPGYFGNGFGHVGRCLALADELKQRDWKIGMVLAGRYSKLVKNSGCEVFSPVFPKRPSLNSQTKNTPAFTYIQDGSAQVIRDGLTSNWRIKAAMLELMLIVQRFRPDVLIGDISLLTWVLGKRTNLPVVQIIRSIMYPGASKIIWWQDPPAGMQSPDITQALNPLLDKWNIPRIENVDGLLQGDLYLVPSLPELEPLPQNVVNTHYVGAMVRKQQVTSDLPAPLVNNPNKQKVYITMGGGAQGVGNRDFFKIINTAFVKTPWIAVVSTGKNFDLKNMPQSPENVFYYQWVCGPDVIKAADLVVFTGGYGTMMETIKFGVPSISIPFHSEQESNARRIVQNNAGCLLSSEGENDQDTLISFKTNYGNFVGCIRKEFNLKPERLKNTIEKILSTEKYKTAAKNLSVISKTYEGCKIAAELIEKKLG